MRQLYLTTCALCLSGCATTSFAPPQVDVHNPMTGLSIDRQCNVTYGAGDTITKDVDGAQALISNYLDSYRCVMRVSANGRQPWEILSFLSLIAATTAAALGAGKNVAIIGASANSVFTAGNGYYAPRDQTAILNDAVDALACIQDESVGIDPLELKVAGAHPQTFGVTAMTNSEISVTAERQYFNMVYSALITTERATAKRLANRGFDAAGIQAQVDALTEKIKQAQAEKDSNKGGNGGNGAAPADNSSGSAPGTKSLYANLISADPVRLSEGLHTVQLDLAVVDPKLQKCALRAQGAG